MVPSKLKSSTKAKVKTKPKVKSKAKKIATKKKVSKPTVKRKLVKISKTKKMAKSKSKPKKLITYSTKQKISLLGTIAKLIELHKSDKDGLKSMTQINRILDKYNQNYTTPNDKFDAIVNYGVHENPNEISKNFYVDVHPKDQETSTLYQYLLEISKGKTQFTDMKDKMNDLYQNALDSRPH